MYELKREMFEYLDSHLSNETKQKIKNLEIENMMEEILSVLSEWVYDERVNLLVKKAGEIARNKAKDKGMEVSNNDFVRELKEI